MHRFKVFLKDGTSTYAECKWVDLLTVSTELDNNNKFIKIGDKVFAKDFIAQIHKLENTEE